jgi:hypothetical protein
MSAQHFSLHYSCNDGEAMFTCIPALVLHSDRYAGAFNHCISFTNWSGTLYWSLTTEVFYHVAGRMYGTCLKIRSWYKWKQLNKELKLTDLKIGNLSFHLIGTELNTMCSKSYIYYCYLQGMHEILAPLMFVLHCDHQVLLHTREHVTVRWLKFLFTSLWNSWNVA